MRLSRWSLAAGELAVVGGALALAFALPSAPFSVGDASWFLAGLILLTLSDVWLPRGDAVGMSSSLVFATVLWFDARAAIGMLVASELVAILPIGRRAVLSQSLGGLATKAVSALACSALLVPLSLHPGSSSMRFPNGAISPDRQVFLVLVGLLFAALEFGLAQLEIAARTGRPVRSSLLGGFAFGGWLVAAQATAGVLVALMFRTMGAWGIGVGVLMILVMRQSFVLLLEIRQGYNATIDALIRAMEAQGPGHEGLAERNASISTSVARELGIHGRELERLRYAALLIAVGIDPEVTGEARVASAKIIQNVEFLSDVVPILRVCESPSHTKARRTDLMAAYIVTAVASATGTLPCATRDQLAERMSPRNVRSIDRAVAEVCACVELMPDTALAASGETL